MSELVPPQNSCVGSLRAKAVVFIGRQGLGS